MLRILTEPDSLLTLNNKIMEIKFKALCERSGVFISGGMRGGGTPGRHAPTWTNRGDTNIELPSSLQIGEDSSLRKETLTGFADPQSLTEMLPVYLNLQGTNDLHEF